MLKKEILLYNSKNKWHLEGTVALIFGFDSQYYTLTVSDNDNRKPYWNIDTEKIIFQNIDYDSEYNNTTIYCDEAIKKQFQLQVTDYDSKRSQVFKFNNIGKYSSESIIGDPLDFDSKPWNTIKLVFDPPPTDISKTYFKSSMEESVDDKQRITDDVECGKFYNCHGKLLRKTFDNFKVQNNGQSNRKDILRRQCSTSLLKNGVRKSPCKHSSIPMDKCWSYRVSWYRTSKYPLRARVGEHNLRIHKRSRLYCQCVYSSVVVVQEALYVK